MAGKGSTGYALAPSGLVFAWGRNGSYEYGMSGGNGVLTKVPLTNRVMTFGAGSQSGMAVTYALNADSDISTATYSWGNNNYYAISPANSSTISTPTVMVNRNNVALIGGSNSVYTIDKDGKLIMSGRGNYGQLANGNNQDSSSASPFYAFTKADGTAAEDAIGAAAGYTHSLYTVMFGVQVTMQILSLQYRMPEIV